MELDPQEQKRGTIWFLISAPVAILLVVALYNVDEFLSNSTAEADTVNTLKELRSAQTNLKSGNTDPRLGSTLRVVKNSPAEVDSGHDEHAEHEEAH